MKKININKLKKDINRINGIMNHIGEIMGNSANSEFNGAIFSLRKVKQHAERAEKQIIEFERENPSF